ncbi:[acyl-carrier-protein] S-malonyltransferase [Proteiniborus ethanoligenes]|uniref:Malonyl CoA-acyl carrier protein transacylase n=1 Tax=Proteiniborus ethanoligenes TaxID=415015 RepID=A0A1H3PM38_9FIRM|nr:ACP S-malonyltransferase [Proteiniborus ethanoligenes]SDZ02117.1 [acyl-carrier-protein] S-malonyltransferase [Proteiniborus ethanoligenes]
MRKIAFLFPGQGAQYIGMGKEIAEKYPSANKIFQISNESLNLDLKNLCFEGPDEELMKTEFTQPAILTTSVAILKVIGEHGINAEICAGLSLGEYTALVYSNVLSFEEAVKLVKKRGRFMQEAVPEGKGAMAAIIGLDNSLVMEAMDKARTKGVVEGANYNCPGQIVISGEVEAVKDACTIAKELGAKKATLLSVSAPFHCSLLKNAGDKLKDELVNVSINQPIKKIISNVTGDYIINSDEIKDLLTKQVSMPVLWEKSIEQMIDDGINTFIEIGPGKTLIGFAKKISKKYDNEFDYFNVENIETLDNLLTKI